MKQISSNQRVAARTRTSLLTAIWCAAATLLLLALPAAQPALAIYSDAFPAQPGFTHSALRPDDTPPGLRVSGAPFFRGGPAIGDVDGNTANGQEIVIGGRDGRVYVYRSNGSLLWQADAVPACTLTDPVGDGKINSVPAIGKLYGPAGTPYVVATYGTVLNTDCQGGAVALRGTDGAVTWRFTVPSNSVDGFLDGVASSPALADADHDGTLEVAFGAFDRELYLLNHDGTLRFDYDARDTVWSSPSFANIDSDADLELIVGTDITANSGLKTQNGGYVYAFDTQPVTGNNGVKKFGTGYIWRNFYNQTIYSSPAVADLDGDGKLEVAIGSGCFYNNDSGAGRWVKVLDAATGAERATLNSNGCSRSSPAVGDLDGDGKLEVVTVVNGQYSGQSYSWVQAWDADNPTAKWTAIPKGPLGGDDANAEDLGSPVIADIDGNGSPEVVVAYFNAVVVLNGANGAQLTCTGQGCGSTKTLFTWMPLKSSPAVGDLDGDGDLEVVAGTTHSNDSSHGYLYVWTNFAGLLGSPNGAQAAYSAPWPQFRGNGQHTGATPSLQTSVTQLTVLLKAGTSRSFPVTFGRSDGAALQWSASESDPQQVVQLSRSSGSAADTLDVTLSAPGAPGTYNASIQAQGAGLQPVTLPITVIAANQVYSVSLPVARR